MSDGAIAAAALALAARGVPVFPCDPASKWPLVATGFKAATTDSGIVSTWWKQWPAAMIGMPTGASSGVFVLDIDRDEGKGVDGFATLAAMELVHGPLPETRAQRTPRGGEHRLFAWPGFKVRNSASKLGAGLDIRGDGGYVIVAPSVNADGVRYEWLHEGEPVAAPQWLLLLIEGPKAAAGVAATKALDRRTSYAAAALAGEARKVASAAAGQRNVALNRAAYTFTASITDRHPTDLAMLQGARLVSASETEEGRAWAESRIKQMTGGDTIRARFMRQDFFEYRAQFKLVIVGNHKSVLRNVDDAARRRFNIIPFVHKPPAPDRQLEEKLKAEWPAILAWAIEGAIDWQMNGLVRPTVVADATNEYFTEQDSVRQWVEECCETGSRTLSDTTANLFASWSAYAQANGEKSGTTKWFSQILHRHGYEPVAETPGHRKKRGFLRIRVKAADTSDQWQNRMEAAHDAVF